MSPARKSKRRAIAMFSKFSLWPWPYVTRRQLARIRGGRPLRGRRSAGRPAADVARRRLRVGVSEQLGVRRDVRAGHRHRHAVAVVQAVRGSAGRQTDAGLSTTFVSSVRPFVRTNMGAVPPNSPRRAVRSAKNACSATIAAGSSTARPCCPCRPPRSPRPPRSHRDPVEAGRHDLVSAEPGWSVG